MSNLKNMQLRLIWVCNRKKVIFNIFSKKILLNLRFSGKMLYKVALRSYDFEQGA